MVHKITGLIGYPTSHSLSPVIHEYWLKRYKIDADYKLFTTQPKRLRQTMLHMRKKNVLGVNITVPHKQSVMGYLDNVDEIAARIGAVNTIVNRKGSFVGTNTDAYGFIANLKNQLGSLAPYLKHAVIIGAGGASRAVLVGLKDAGAKHITVTNRTRETATLMAKELGAKSIPWGGRADALEEATLVVNTTSLGMKKQPPLELDLKKLPAKAAVCDIVYAPQKTQLLEEAEARGNPTVGGIGMLIYQAQLAFKEWHGVMPEVTNELRRLVTEKVA